VDSGGAGVARGGAEEVVAQAEGAPVSRRAATAVLLLATLTVATAQTIVVTVLPVFQRELATSATGVTWLLTAFMLASAVAAPIAGRVGDLFGYRPVLVGCLVSFVAGTVLAGLADYAGSLAGVLAGRVLQGFGGGVFPLVFGLARTVVAPERRAGVIAAVSAMFGIGGALGMVLAGPVTGYLGTAWLFWGLLVPVAATLACVPLLPRGRVGTSGAVDVVGAGLLSSALVCLLLAISQARGWGWGPAGALAAAAVVFGAAFAVVELRTRVPLVDLWLLRHRPLATVNAATVVISIAMFAAVTLLPQLVQSPVFGATATETGLVMIPIAVCMLVTGSLAGRFAGRVPLQAGAALAAVAFLLLAVAHDRVWHVLLAGAILGAGYGLAFAALGNLVVDAVQPAHTGAATGINTILRTVGGATGAQLSAVVLAGSAGYVPVFVTFAVIAVAAVGVAGFIPAKAPGKHPAAASAPPRRG
jgi:MFS family permease